MGVIERRLNMTTYEALIHLDSDALYKSLMLFISMLKTDYYKLLENDLDTKLNPIELEEYTSAISEFSNLQSKEDKERMREKIQSYDIYKMAMFFVSLNMSVCKMIENDLRKIGIELEFNLKEEKNRMLVATFHWLQSEDGFKVMREDGTIIDGKDIVASNPAT